MNTSTDQALQPTMSNARNIGLSVISLVLVLALLGSFLREPIREFGTLVVTEFGLMGLFAYISFVEAVPTPLGGIPMMALSLQGGVGVATVLMVSQSASLLAALLGHALGKSMGLPIRLQEWMEQKYPGRLNQLRDRGELGVAALALLPLPISIGAWAGGAVGVSRWGVLLASLVRLPKYALYLFAIIFGFDVLAF